MNKPALLLIMVSFLVFSSVSHTRDDRNKYSIDEAMNTADAKAKLTKGYTFKFGPQPHGKIIANHGEFMSNKKTNAFNKTDMAACNRAFLSAMLSFQDRISKEGGNAVVNLRSFYKKNEFSSPTEFECGNGAVVAGVTFLGDVVTLNE